MTGLCKIALVVVGGLMVFGLARARVLESQGVRLPAGVSRLAPRERGDIE